MPRVKSQNPKSLKKLCTEFVASNLNHWCNSSSENKRNKCDQEATLSQFDKLPSVLLEEVLHFVCCRLGGIFTPDKKKLKKKSFELLITPNLRSLDLSIGQSKDISYILNLASLRCLDLQTVRMVCSCNCVDMFVHLCAIKFGRLQVLDISQTDAGDNCLQILGMYCKDLRELKVEYCKKITDAGIQGLCVSVNHMGKEDQRLGQCKSIETLFICRTKITKNGIQTALINLPFLKRLKSDFSAAPVYLLTEMHQQDWNRKQLEDIRKYSLDSLHIGKCEYNAPSTYISGNLGLVASLCPSVTSVKVNLIKGLTDRKMLGLLSLKNVNELEIDGHYLNLNSTVTFEGGVVPLLKGFGRSLKELSLSYLTEHVNIRAIIDFCPKLESLWLEQNESYSTTGSAKEDAESHHSKRCRMERKQPLVLKNLKKLCVFYPFGNEYPISVEASISSEDLLSLLSSPSLIDIYISSCPNLTDYIFERASEIHQFLSLEKLAISECDYLTRRGIDVVMNKKTPLKMIEICKCDNITDVDIALLISKARSENWELSVEYASKDEESN